MLVPRKLIYCLFGDYQAIEVVTTAACGLKVKNKTVNVLPDADRPDGCWIWRGEIELAGDRAGIWPIVFAIIKPSFDREEWIRAELGFDQASCLHIMGRPYSKNRRSYGLARFIAGQPNEARLRDFGRYPCEGFGQQVANQAIESFVVNPQLHVPCKSKRSRPVFLISRCYLVPAPYASNLDGLETHDGILVEGSVG